MGLGFSNCEKRNFQRGKLFSNSRRIGEGSFQLDYRTEQFPLDERFHVDNLFSLFFFSFWTKIILSEKRDREDAN